MRVLTKRRALVSFVAAAMLAASLTAAVVLSDNGATVRFRGSVPPSKITLPRFALPDYTGRTISSADLGGQAVLVTFLDTQCTESCPVIASQIGQALDLLDPGQRSQVVALAISTDPDEDTAESVRAFLRRHRVEGKLDYLVAPVPELRPIWDAFQIAPSFDTGDDSLHSAPVRIFDRRSTWVSTLHAGADLTPENLAHDLRKALE